MFRCWPECFKNRVMESRWVTFVSTKSKLRIGPAQPHHLPVTGYLGKNRSCRNSGDALITPNHRLSRYRNVWKKPTVSIDIVDPFTQSQYCPSHSQQTCIVYVQLINFSRRRSTYRPVHGGTPYLRRQARPTRCREPLRIVNSGHRIAVYKDYRSGHNRASERPSTYFVDPGDTPNQGRAQAARSCKISSADFVFALFFSCLWTFPRLSTI